MPCPGGTQRATEEPCQSHSSPVYSYRSCVAPRLHTHGRFEARASRGRNTHHRRSCLPALQQTPNSTATKYGSLSARWNLSQEHVLRTVVAPGCKYYFGLWVFEECYSLVQIGDQSSTINQLAPQAQFRPRAFEKCSALQQLNFERTEYDPTNRNRSIPEGCFFEAGVESLYFQQISAGWDQLHASSASDYNQ